ncbi:hypothetical protein EDD86DRAFT_54859, partial [Gorgonomyces haynaldii]
MVTQQEQQRKILETKISLLKQKLQEQQIPVEEPQLEPDPSTGDKEAELQIVKSRLFALERQIEELKLTHSKLESDYNDSKCELDETRLAFEQEKKKNEQKVTQMAAAASNWWKGSAQPQPVQSFPSSNSVNEEKPTVTTGQTSWWAKKDKPTPTTNDIEELRQQNKRLEEQLAKRVSVNPQTQQLEQENQKLKEELKQLQEKTQGQQEQLQLMEKTVSDLKQEMMTNLEQSEQAIGLHKQLLHESQLKLNEMSHAEDSKIAGGLKQET